jgi:CRP-like cAMP-binding protein
MPDQATAAQTRARGHRANRLLAALSDSVLDQLIPHLALVDLIKDAVVFEAGASTTDVLFPHTGVISIIATDAEGGAVEISMVGSEGVTGLAFILGGEAVIESAVVQIEGRASRMKAEAFRRAVETMPEFKRLLLRYVLAMFTQVAQNVACNQLHAIGKRCARWLLAAHDRVNGDSFELTQQYLATTLGVTRSSVSSAASNLQRAGLITYSRGRLTVLDRTGLEHAACACYRIVEDAFDCVDVSGRAPHPIG